MHVRASAFGIFISLPQHLQYAVMLLQRYLYGNLCIAVKRTVIQNPFSVTLLQV